MVTRTLASVRSRVVLGPQMIGPTTVEVDDRGLGAIDSAVSSWTDQSGNNNHPVQATGSLQPLVKAGLNGYSCVLFDGTDDILVLASAAVLDGPAALTVVVVVYHSAADAYNHWLVGKGNSNAASNNWKMYIHASNDGNVLWRGNWGALTGNGGTNASWRVLAGVYTAGKQSLYINGTLAVSATSLAAINTTAYAVSIGGTGLNETYFGTKGYIQAVYIYPEAKSADQLSRLNTAWINPRYGLSAV